MRKSIIAAVAGLSVCALTGPVYAVTGHIIQVHHGADCVEFVLFEDVPLACIPSPFVVDYRCLDSAASVPWYGIASGQQAELPGQLPYFIAVTSGIDTAYKAYVDQRQIEIVQTVLGATLGAGVSGAEQALLDQTSLVGFTITGTLPCKNLSGGTHSVSSVANINIPPAPKQ